MAIIECVPNFSEGQRGATLAAIAGALRGVKLLHTDRGAGANRTVFTFAGSPEAVVGAAFEAIKVAAELIDMRKHRGEHPRIGAADVVPLVPVSGISLEEVVPLTKYLAQRVGQELGIPVFLYEAASPTGRGLESCRAGEYEGLPEKIKTADFGPTEWSERVARTGASVIGARNFLVAVNFTLSTKELKPALRIARAIRARRQAGELSGIKAIGWVIDEYGLAQVSTNLTDIDAMPLWRAWQIVHEEAKKEGVEVLGTELIGLIPERVLRQAQEELGSIEVLQLNHLAPFDPKERVIEQLL